MATTCPVGKLQRYTKVNKLTTSSQLFISPVSCLTFLACHIKQNVYASSVIATWVDMHERCPVYMSFFIKESSQLFISPPVSCLTFISGLSHKQNVYASRVIATWVDMRDGVLYLYMSVFIKESTTYYTSTFTSMPTCVQSENEAKDRTRVKPVIFAEFMDISLLHQMLCTLIISFLWGAKCQGARKIDHSNKSRSMVSFFFTLG